VLPGAKRAASTEVHTGSTCTLGGIRAAGAMRMGTVRVSKAVDAQRARTGLDGFCGLAAAWGPPVALPSGLQDGCAYAGRGGAGVVVLVGLLLVQVNLGDGSVSRAELGAQATAAAAAVVARL